MFNIVLINGIYNGKTVRQAGLVYNKELQTMYLPTKWAGTFKSPNTARKYLSKISFFLGYLYTQIQDDKNKDEIILNFERHVNKLWIDRWISYRVTMRGGKKSPSNKTIKNDAIRVANYLVFAKKELEAQGIDVPYNGETSFTVKIKRQDSDPRKGVMNNIEKKATRHDFNVAFNPEETSKEAIAEKSQEMGHMFLTDEQVYKFVNSFADKVYTTIAEICFISGMRPFEILGLPRYERYGGGDNFFTTDPVALRELLAKGTKTITYICLGKNRKKRKVKFLIKQLLFVMEKYEPLYQERKRIYEDKNNIKLEPKHLWLSKGSKTDGPTLRFIEPGDDFYYEPNSTPIITAVDGARERANLDEIFGEKVTFYALKHTYCTRFLIEIIQKSKELKDELKKSPESELLDATLRKELQNQVGHDDWETTWTHYIHKAIAAAFIPQTSVFNILVRDAA